MTVLTVVMIGGVLIVITLIVIRFSNDTPVLPETLVLPGNAKATAVTQGTDWVAVVTDADEILIYDRMSGALRQTVQLQSAK